MFQKKDKSSSKGDMSFTDHKNTAPKTPTASCEPPPTPTASSGLGQSSKVSQTLLPVPSFSIFPASRSPSGSKTPKRSDESPVTSSPRPLATPSNGSGLIVPSESSKSDRRRLKKSSIPSFKRTATSSGRDTSNVAPSPSLGTPSSNDLTSLGRSRPMNAVPPIMTYVTDLTSAYDDVSTSNAQNTPKVAQAPSLGSVAGRHPGKALPILMRTPSGRFDPSTLSNRANLDAGDYGRAPPLPSGHTPRDNVPPSSIARPVARSAGRIQVRDGDLTAESRWYTPRPTPTPSRPQTPHRNIARDNEPVPGNYSIPVAESVMRVEPKSDDAISKVGSTSLGRSIARPSRPQIPSRNIARDDASTPGTVAVKTKSDDATSVTTSLGRSIARPSRPQTPYRNIARDNTSTPSTIAIKTKSDDATSEAFVTTSLGRVIPRPARPQIPSRNIARDNASTPGDVAKSAMRIEAKSEDATPEGFVTTSLGRVIPRPSRPCPPCPQIPSRNIAREIVSTPGTIPESAIRVKTRSEDATPEGFVTTSLGRVIPRPSRPCPPCPQIPSRNIARDIASTPGTVAESAMRVKARSEDATPEGFVTTSLGRVIPRLSRPCPPRPQIANRNMARDDTSTPSTDAFKTKSEDATPKGFVTTSLGRVIPRPSRPCPPCPQIANRNMARGSESTTPDTVPESAMRVKAKSDDATPKGFVTTSLGRIIPCPSSHDTAIPDSRKVKGIVSPPSKSDFTTRDLETSASRHGPRAPRDPVRHPSPTTSSSQSLPYYSDRATKDKGKGRLVADVLSDPSQEAVSNESGEFPTQGPKTQDSKASPKREDKRERKNSPPLILEVIPSRHTFDPNAPAPGLYTVSELLNLLVDNNITYTEDGDPVPISVGDWKVRVAGTEGHDGRIPTIASTKVLTNRILIDTTVKFVKAAQAKARIAREERNRARQQNLSTVHPDRNASSVGQKISSLKKTEGQAERVREHKAEFVNPDQELHSAEQKISALKKAEDEAERTRERNLHAFYPYKKFHPVGQRILALNKAEDEAERTKEQNVNTAHLDERLSSVSQRILALKKAEDEAERTRQHYPDVIYPDRRLRHVGQKISTLTKVEDGVERVKEQSLEFVHPDNTLHHVGPKISALKKVEDESRRGKEQSLEFVHHNQKLRHVGKHISVLKEVEDESECAEKDPSLEFVHPNGKPLSTPQKILALKKTKVKPERAKGPSGRKKLLVRESYVNFDGSAMSDEQMEVLWDEVEEEKKANSGKLVVFPNMAAIKNIELQATFARIRVKSDQACAEAFEDLKQIVKRIKAAKLTAVAKAALLNPTHEFLDIPAKIMLYIMRELLVVAPEEEVVPYHYVAGKVMKNADGGRWGLRNKPQVDILVALCATQDKRVKSALDTGRNVLYRENQFAFRKPDELILFIETIGPVNLSRMDFHTNLVVSYKFLTKYTQSLEVKWLALWQPNLKSVMQGRELATPDWKPQNFDDEKVEAETAAAPLLQFDWTEWKLDRASGVEDGDARSASSGFHTPTMENYQCDMFVQGEGDLYEVSEHGEEGEEDDETSIASENDTLDREIKELIAAAGAA